MRVSDKTLKHLAFTSWLTGAVVLFLKGYALFDEARGLRPDHLLTYLPFPVAAVVGSLKARFLFLPSCRKNLARIASLADPRPWQFFRAGFFAFLFSMTALGAWLSAWAAGKYGMLITVSAVDLTLSVALLGSLPGFRIDRPKTGFRG